ncbi:GumC family protein [Halomonas sp. HMF6819]|uniref:GumC family protein n=1 Tax=unclassified Halomonas TaxID=2609666 RepID=UPI002076A02A|nr:MULTISPECIES: hypothetical protein [unclassified Halomonas]
MSSPTQKQPRRLVRVWYFIRDGLPSAGRYRRYIIAIAPFLIGIWALVACYIVLAPVTYKSSMSLILPGSGVGGMLSLETIGQASSQTSSAFSSPSLSPTQNYKRLLTADLTLRSGAELLNDGSDRLPSPTINLIDQTNLILVSIKGSSPEQAQSRLEALRRAFLTVLDQLREDEAARREAADRDRLDELQQKLQEAQLRVIRFQGDTGLATMDQFGKRISVVDALRATERELQQALSEKESVTRSLSDLLALSVDQARSAQLLKADPLFQSLLESYADTLSEWTQAQATLGPNHITLAELDAQRVSLNQAMLQRGQTLTDLPLDSLREFVDLSVSDSRERLLDAFLAETSGVVGLQASLEQVQEQIKLHDDDMEALVQTAARLADFLREQRVAQAVFSSALARLDTNKSDPFASYPLVQTFETPSLPGAPSSPSLPLAIVGGVLGSLLVTMGFLLLWLRQPIIQLILPKK